MKGKLEFKQEFQGDKLVYAVYYNGVSCGVIRPEPDRGAWYKWGKIHNYDTSLDGSKSWVIQFFNELDVFVERLKIDATVIQQPIKNETKKIVKKSFISKLLSIFKPLTQ